MSKPSSERASLLALVPALVDTRREYDHLSAIYVPIASGVFVIVVLAIGFAVLRYRHRPPERAARWHEHNPLEAGYALALMLVVVVLLFLTFTAEHRVDTVTAHESPLLTVEVTGAKWEWQFEYPDYGFSVRSGTVGRQPLQVAGRFPVELRMYKAPPPEISSEQFYETDETRGFARGFSIQTVGPLPIEWAQHVLAGGHWGQALREYMRDYNHWFTLGALSELLPQPGNRVTIAPDLTDCNGIPVARMEYSQCENDRKNISTAKQTMRDIFAAADAQDILEIDRYAHLVGGCRMGSDPEASVVNFDHRAWEVPNLFIADGSVMPTQGSANPALTIMALSSRLAERLVLKRLDAQASRPRARAPRPAVSRRGGG